MHRLMAAPCMLCAQGNPLLVLHGDYQKLNKLVEEVGGLCVVCVLRWQAEFRARCHHLQVKGQRVKLKKKEASPLELDFSDAVRGVYILGCSTDEGALKRRVASVRRQLMEQKLGCALQASAGRKGRRQLHVGTPHTRFCFVAGGS